MDEIDRLLTPDLPPTHKYYWKNRSSRYHISRMLRIAPLEQLQDKDEVSDSKYLKHRVATIDSPDNTRSYDFLIEYDIYNPSQGIYFGCKSVTRPGFRHSRAVSLALEDWRRVRPHVILRLNNTFIDKDFTHRFKEPDNAHDNTFWPFWISLYDDEDPHELAVRSLSIIASTYRQLFEGTLPHLPDKEDSEKEISPLRTAFTETAYTHLRTRLLQLVKVSTPATPPDSGILPKPQQAWSLFANFLQHLETLGIIHRVAYYERAWMLDARYSDVDLKCIMTLFFQKLSTRLTTGSIQIPWSSLICLFLHSDGTPFKQQIKTLSVTASTRRHWIALLSDI